MNNRILSGIQPSGDLHVGNYLGSISDWVELQESGKFECYFFIADLHSLTEDFQPGEKKRQQILDLMITFLASGLDPKKSTLFIQSQVPAHTELAWIFDTLTPIAEMERMTQYKDKSARQGANINVGLFAYPILQAADILLYKPSHVPVGHDQIQHLELTNTIVRKFNHKFGKIFTEVKPYAQKPLRIMSLSDPARKMSKSEPGSFIGIFDTPAEIKKKLSRAVTATDAPKGQMPLGVKNLFDMLKEFGDNETYQDFIEQYETGKIKYSALKETLATAIGNYFQPMREKREELKDQTDFLAEVIVEGSRKANEVAGKTLAEVKEKIGLI